MKKTKIIVDIMMTVLLFVLMGFHLTGEMWHEISGTVMLFLFVIHHILNRSWIKGVTKGSYNAYRIFQTVINAALLLGVCLLMLSGIAMSGYVFAWLPSFVSKAFARSVHLIASHAVYLIMCMHIGLHFGRMIGKMGGRIKSLRRPWNKLIVYVLRILAVLIAIYGATVVINRKFFAYIFGREKFASFDYSESVLNFFMDYAAVMGLCIFVAHYLGKFLRPGLGNRLRGILQWMRENRLKGVLALAGLAAGLTLGVLYGIPYIQRHFISLSLSRTTAVGTEKVDPGDRKGIVIYFTRVGNTDFEPDVDAVSSASLMSEDGRLVGNAELLADMVKSATGFDTYAIRVERKYSSSYTATVSEAREEQKEGYVPVFTGEAAELGNYDTVILIYPLWWWTLPVPVSEYLKQADLSGKDIYCICTHGGSGYGSSLEDLSRITSGRVSDRSLEVLDKDVINAYPAVLEWLKEIF